MQAIHSRRQGAVPFLAAVLLSLAATAVTPLAQAQTPPPASAPVPVAATKYLAPGFSGLTRNDLVAVMPVDVELFSLSAGGIPEPRADWTASAHTHLKAAIAQKKKDLGLKSLEVSEAQADDFAEQISLHAAVAGSVALHHGIGGVWALPSKNNLLDWSFDDAMKPVQARTGARYGLFVWIRDSYASAERKAAMVALALLGVGIAGGSQIGYASLVDLETGRLLWFNRLARGTGDLREPASAAETIETLLTAFPAGQ
jgi:hypothetical protein